jgi:carbon storage regulator
MLILTRRPTESIRINNNVRVTVLGFRGSQIRLGVEASRDIPVDREEVWEEKQEQHGKTPQNEASDLPRRAAAGGRKKRPHRRRPAQGHR